MQTRLETRDGIACQSDLISFLLRTPILRLLNIMAFPKSLLILSKVPKQQNINGPMCKLKNTID
jgi:hypothetical protein